MIKWSIQLTIEIIALVFFSLLFYGNNHVLEYIKNISCIIHISLYRLFWEVPIFNTTDHFASPGTSLGESGGIVFVHVCSGGNWYSCMSCLSEWDNVRSSTHCYFCSVLHRWGRQTVKNMSSCYLTLGTLRIGEGLWRLGSYTLETAGILVATGDACSPAWQQAALSSGHCAWCLTVIVSDRAVGINHLCHLIVTSKAPWGLGQPLSFTLLVALPDCP